MRRGRGFRARLPTAHRRLWSGLRQRRFLSPARGAHRPRLHAAARACCRSRPSRGSVRQGFHAATTSMRHRGPSRPTPPNGMSLRPAYSTARPAHRFPRPPSAGGDRQGEGPGGARR
jgi:hypothetical protein